MKFSALFILATLTGASSGFAKTSTVHHRVNEHIGFAAIVGRPGYIPADFLHHLDVARVGKFILPSHRQDLEIIVGPSEHSLNPLLVLHGYRTVYCGVCQNLMLRIGSIDNFQYGGVDNRTLINLPIPSENFRAQIDTLFPGQFAPKTMASLRNFYFRVLELSRHPSGTVTIDQVLNIH